MSVFKSERMRAWLLATMVTVFAALEAHAAPPLYRIGEWSHAPPGAIARWHALVRGTEQLRDMGRQSPVIHCQHREPEWRARVARTLLVGDEPRDIVF